MKLEIGTADFVLTISNVEPVFYQYCRATLDGKYQFDTPFDLGAPRLHLAAPKVLGSDSQVRINLADFSRGGERYDWQKRIPTRVEVECSEYLVPPPDALDEYGFVDWRKFQYEAQWTKSSARFTGGFK